MLWNAVKLWLRIAFANAAVVFVVKLIEQLGLLQLPAGIEMYLGALLAAILAWLRNRYGDVLTPASSGRRFAGWALRAVGVHIR